VKRCFSTRRAWLLQALSAVAVGPVWALDDAEDRPFTPGAAPGAIHKLSVLPLIMASQVREPELGEYVARADGRSDSVVLRTDAAGQPRRDRKGVPLFQVSQAWADSVAARLQQQGGLEIERYPDRKIALAARRLFDFQYLTTSAEAVLDLRVETAGYSHSMGGGGWVPYLAVNAALSSMRSGEEIAAFTYWSDHRSKPKDRRCFPASPALIFDSVATLQAQVDTALAGFQQSLAKMTDKLVDDVLHCVAGDVPQV
jgi:hypothetical protein